uniref:Uncharacterized protein n=1 Tax=Arundo donax TaxID=35708 RepID=A0A0A8ZEX8_ARUDO
MHFFSYEEIHPFCHLLSNFLLKYINSDVFLM